MTKAPTLTQRPETVMERAIRETGEQARAHAKRVDAWRKVIAGNIFAKHRFALTHMPEHKGVRAFGSPLVAWFNAGDAMRHAHACKIMGDERGVRQHVATAMRWRAAAKTGGMIQPVAYHGEGVFEVRIGAEAG